MWFLGLQTISQNAHGYLEVDRAMTLGDFSYQERYLCNSHITGIKQKSSTLIPEHQDSPNQRFKRCGFLFFNLKYIIHFPWGLCPLEHIEKENLTGVNI